MTDEQQADRHDDRAGEALRIDDVVAPSESSVRLRTDRRWRVLLAHDAAAPTCDGLVVAVEEALRNVDLFDTSSVDDARAVLETTRPHVCFVCLDLPPAPVGGVRLATLALREHRKVVLVTRSLRWLPADATALQRLPWITPDAGPAEVARAIATAVTPAPVVERREPPVDPSGRREPPVNRRLSGRAARR